MFRGLVLFSAIILCTFAAATGWALFEASGRSISPLLYIASAQAISLVVLTGIAIALERTKPKQRMVSTADPEMRDLLASRAQYSALYKNSPVPYITVTADGTIEQYNLAATRLFDTTRTHLIGQNLLSYFLAAEDGSTDVVIGKFKTTANISDTQIPIQTTKNEERWILLSAFTNESTGQKLISLVDITEQKKVDIAKSEFVALATHQLRTPIAAIRWNVELLERSIRKHEEEKYYTYLEKVNRNVSRMILLINDFLSVSKLETGTFAAKEETIELSNYFAGIVEEFAKPISQKRIQITTSCQPEPFTFTTDSRLFHIITSNLVSNAVKYVPADGVINWGYHVTGEQITITVQDSGIGIPVNEQAGLFKKFFRASNAQKHQAEGTGLGLYVVKQSVEQLGGTIAMQSTENVGTTFVVTLPIRPGQAPVTL